MNCSHKTIYLLLIVSFLFYGFSNKKCDSDKLKLYSKAFNEGMSIPSKFTCDSSNISPPLHWENVPDKTKSFAIIMDDPDAPMGTWVHWVVYNIPASVRELPEKKNIEGMKASNGLNSWEEQGYNGPCPPDGQHRYIFKLYALDQMITGDRMSSDELTTAMKGHVLGEATLMGVFGK